jgi:hypothetical protein
MGESSRVGSLRSNPRLGSGDTEYADANIRDERNEIGRAQPLQICDPADQQRKYGSSNDRYAEQSRGSRRGCARALEGEGKYHRKHDRITQANRDGRPPRHLSGRSAHRQTQQSRGCCGSDQQKRRAHTGQQGFRDATEHIAEPGERFDLDATTQMVTSGSELQSLQ